jgi:hypothetical protein
MITEFNKTNLTTVRADINALLAKYGADNGIDFDIGGISFNGNTFTRSYWSGKMNYTITKTPKRAVQSSKMVLNHASTLATGEHYHSTRDHKHLNTKLDSRGTPEDDFLASLEESAINLYDGESLSVLENTQQYQYMDTQEYYRKPLIKEWQLLANSADQDKFGNSYVAPDGKLITLKDDPNWQYTRMKIWRSEIGDPSNRLSPYMGEWTAIIGPVQVNGVG